MTKENSPMTLDSQDNKNFDNDKDSQSQVEDTSVGDAPKSDETSKEPLHSALENEDKKPLSQDQETKSSQENSDAESIAQIEPEPVSSHKETLDSEETGDAQVLVSEDSENTEEQPVVTLPVEETPKHETNQEIPNPLKSFEDVPFDSKVQELLQQVKWRVPRELDSLVLPHALLGKDVLIQAESKTSAIMFLTLLHRLISVESQELQAVVLFSSEALAEKSCNDFLRLFKDSEISASTLGEDPESIDSEEMSQNTKRFKEKSRILFTTPKLLKQAIWTNEWSMDAIQICICRDLSQMLKFESSSEELHHIFSKLPESAQKLLFSGAFTEKISAFTKLYLGENSLQISVERNRATIPSVTHQAFLCETPDKFKILLGIVKASESSKYLVYTNSKLTASWIFHKLKENSISVENIAGEFSSQKRNEAMESLKTGTLKVLLATDYEGRHLSSCQVDHVIHFDLPENGESYLQRMGDMSHSESATVSSLVCEEFGQNYQHVSALLGTKTPKPVWAPQDYLSIQDKSGNPFLDKNLMPMDRRPSRGDRDRNDDRNRKPSFSQDRSSSRRDQDFSDRQDRYKSRSREDSRKGGEGQGGRYDSEKSRSGRFERGGPQRRDRQEDRGNKRSSSAPKIKPRPRRTHNPNKQSTHVGGTGKIIAKNQKKKGLLSKIFSIFSGKK